MSTIDRIAALSYDEVPAGLAAEFGEAELDAKALHKAVAAALAEDLPEADVTSWATIPAEQVETADFVAREPGTVAGLGVAELVFRYVLGNDIDVRRPIADGQTVQQGDVLLSVTGPTALLLSAERTALNFACHLSGVATATAAWVTALEGTGARVRDTRKTIPGWRDLEKYAVRCGGGVNHRHSLSDMALVKDNHVIAAGGVVPAYELIRSRFPSVPVQVEVDSLEQLRELLEIGVESILLDNMEPTTLREAVAITAGRATLEASGGLTLDVAAEYGATGVDFLAVGALTHSAKVFDIGMDLRS
ncbi:nicotinate-nucleotide pyrophosphorylase (carboxylating) [Nocardioides daedukensis]|uniref:Nicotinate-nucleotide pyrophosphorylase [carboxylating] n=1 Tax=Nocardioides daedukensis TaxID=634462 RepID=A0A7Y9UNU5_9ACTN|nr:carboxylating nicotinate-nucleotide diphosphorylase [Nocardioides daedukensis]NYG58918.1 nicotinate-nucleotide pyrophosphorylase (carboxylating) [Nocardioides daedukensis]